MRRTARQPSPPSDATGGPSVQPPPFPCTYRDLAEGRVAVLCPCLALRPVVGGGRSGSHQSQQRPQTHLQHVREEEGLCVVRCAVAAQKASWAEGAHRSERPGGLLESSLGLTSGSPLSAWCRMGSLTYVCTT